MSNSDIGHQSDDKDPAAKRTAQRPEPPGEASGSGQAATRGSTSGEKVHGEKLQSASGNRSSGASHSDSHSGSGQH